MSGLQLWLPLDLRCNILVQVCPLGQVAAVGLVRGSLCLSLLFRASHCLSAVLLQSPSGHYHQGSFAASRPSLNVDLRAASETIRSRWQAVAGACKSSFGKFTRNRHLQPDLADEPGPSAVNGAAVQDPEPRSSDSLSPASTTSQAEGQGAAAS